MKLKAASMMAVGSVFIAIAAQSDEAAFCPERPGQTTPTCVMTDGDTLFESGLASWSRQRDSLSSQDQWIYGDHLLRHGIGHHTELQFGWRMLVHSADVDRTTGTHAASSGTGDVTVGLLHNFSSPDGPVALQVFASLPTGHHPGGAEDWGAGIRLPLGVALDGGWTLGLTPEIDAAVNASGRDRHALLGGAVGIGHDITEGLSASLDLAVFRDQDPAGHATTAVWSVTLAWQTGPDTQIDAGFAAGLNRHSPDRQAYVGFAHRF